MNRSIFVRRLRLAWLAALLAGLLAAVAPWLDRFRPVPLEERAAYELHVTSGADAGTGSLREAIFMADRTNGKVRVVLDVPLITLGAPLPPIVNPAGVVLEGRYQATRIDAAGMAAGPVLDISAPSTVLSRIEINGAPREGILLRRSGARLTGVRLRQGETGIYLADGADDLTLTDSDFDGNGVGIQLPPDAHRVRISNSRFQRQVRAGIWSVSPDSAPAGVGLHILGNRFEADTVAVVLVNTPAQVERNTFLGARTAALLMSGAGMIVRANRVRSGLGFAISGDALDRSVISENEIDHNCAGGILVRNAQNTHVLSNRLYANGYGIVVVRGASASPPTLADNLIVRQFEDGIYVIGGSPLIRRNRLMDNRRSGIRLASLRAEGDQLSVPQPFLEANVFAGNGADLPTRDEYVASTAAVEAGKPADCAWRFDPAEASSRR